MIEAVAVATAVVAWLGAVLVVLSDARRGLAVGTVVLAAGLGLERLVAGQPAVGLVIFAGGLAAAAAGLRQSRFRGWGVLTEGSTPRVVLCLVVGALALYFGRVVILEPADWQGRAAVLAVGLLGAGRLLTSDEERAAMAAASAVVLALTVEATFFLPAAALTLALLGAAGAALVNGVSGPGEAVDA